MTDTKSRGQPPGPEKYALEKWRTGGFDKQDFFILVLFLMVILAMILVGLRAFADSMQG